MAKERITVAELEAKHEAYVVQTDDQLLKLMQRVADLETDLQDDGTLNQSYKVVNMAPKDTLYTKFSFFFTNTLYKLVLVALILYAAYLLLPMIFSTFGYPDKDRPSPVKTVIEVTQTEFDIIKEAFSTVVREINAESISDILEARDAIYANIPTSVSSQIVSKISLDLPLNKLQGVLENILSELKIKPTTFSLNAEPVVEEPAVIEESVIEPSVDLEPAPELVEEEEIKPIVEPAPTQSKPTPAPNTVRRFFRY